MSQEESEHNEVDGMKKGVDLTEQSQFNLVVIIM